MDEDWLNLLTAALRDLEADQRLVPGSRLMQQLLRVPDRNFDIRSHLADRHLTFSKFLEQFRPNLVVRLRGGSDMLVGLDGATEGPPLREARTVREDVYRAFTRVEARPYNYSRAHNRFTQDDLPADDVVPGPTITQDDLIEERREFAGRQVEAVQTELRHALENPQALTAFQKAVNGSRLQRQWRRFRIEKILLRVDAWVAEHGMAVSPAWLNEEAPVAAWPIRTVVEYLLAEMSDDELRGLNVPVRAVEAAFRRVNPPPR